MFKGFRRAKPEPAPTLTPMQQNIIDRADDLERLFLEMETYEPCDTDDCQHFRHTALGIVRDIKDEHS